MTSRTASKRGSGPKPPTRRHLPTTSRIGGTRRWWRGAAIVATAVVALVGLYAIFRNSTTTSPAGTTPAGGSGFAYQVGQPGPGQPAPGFSLDSTAGGQLDLASLRGKTVLLYFQEGLMCQPCWEQISDLEKSAADLKAAGIDQVVSITTDPVDLITRKVSDMGLSTVVLSDPDLAVSKAYHANEYGMMGTSRDGHTFILVKPDGSIGWRADYGGAPNFTMFLPTAAILTDLRAATGAPS